MVDAIHVHEDVWGMRNLYPMEVRLEVEEDIAAAAAAGEKNRAPSGFGYTDIYVMKPPSRNYADFSLTLKEAERTLAPIFPRVRRFNATVFSAMDSSERDQFGSYEEDSWCFGLDENCFLKLDAKGDLVRNIWFDLNTDDAEAVGRLRDAIGAIDTLVPSMIADYYMDFSGPISESGVLDTYFAILAEQRRRAEQAWHEYRARHDQESKPQGMIRKLLNFFGGNR